MIRIFSKAAFQFGPGANRNGDIDSFITVPGTFQDMPDKYKDDKTFKLALKCGMVNVIDNKAAQVIAEETTISSVDIDPIKAYYEKLKTMNANEVSIEAEKYSVTYNKNDKLSETKKKVFEAYKLANTTPEE